MFLNNVKYFIKSISFFAFLIIIINRGTGKYNKVKLCNANYIIIIDKIIYFIIGQKIGIK